MAGYGNRPGRSAGGTVAAAGRAAPKANQEQRNVKAWMDQGYNRSDLKRAADNLRQKPPKPSKRDLREGRTILQGPDGKPFRTIGGELREFAALSYRRGKQGLTRSEEARALDLAERARNGGFSVVRNNAGRSAVQATGLAKRMAEIAEKSARGRG